MNRRTFHQRLGALAAGVSALGAREGKATPARPQPESNGPFGGGIYIGDRISPEPSDAELDFFKQCGVEFATIWTTIDRSNADYMIRTRKKLESHQIQLLNIGILDLHCDPTIVLALPGVDEKIEQYRQYLGHLHRAGIEYTTYAHMANIKMAPYYQTGQEPNVRGVMSRAFDMEEAKDLPLSHGRVYEDEEIWRSFERFIRAVMPVAERNGVRIGLHPDDPPVPSLGGVARIFRTPEAYDRALEIADSENFGLCFCVGTWAEGGDQLGKTPVEMIRYFGPRGRLFKIHFRNVDAPLPKFRETYVDEGYLDMHEVMRALAETGFNGVIIPDHVPGGALAPGAAYTLGYIRALRDRAYADLDKA